MSRGGKRPGAGRQPGLRNKRTEAAIAEAEASGELPMAYMLRVMRDPSADDDRRDDMAKAAAPLCHPRLSSIEATVKQSDHETTQERLAREEAEGKQA